MTIHSRRSNFLSAWVAIGLAAVWVPSFVDVQTPSKSPSGSTAVPTTTSVPNLAVTWAKNEKDGNFAGYATGTAVQPWTGMCAKFVANAYGAPTCGAVSASQLWKTLSATVSDVPDKATTGVLVFWSWTDNKGGDLGGHVGIYVGDKYVISTDGKLAQPICIETVDQVTAKLKALGNAQYLGYAPAPANWPGPLLVRNSPLDFGGGDVTKKAITLVNAGAKQLTVLPMLSAKAAEIDDKTKDPPYSIDKPRLASSIGPFALETDTLKLLPGQTGEVVVKLDPKAPGDPEAEVHFLVAGVGMASARVRWRGMVAPAAASQPDPIWFNLTGISGRTLLGVCGFADNQRHAFIYEVGTWPSGSGYLAYGDGVKFKTVGSIWYDPTRFRTIEMPGASWIRPTGIDGANIVGQYRLTGSPGEHAFLYDGKSWTKLESSGIDVPYPNAVSGNCVVGVYGATREKSFLYEVKDKSWTFLKKPKARATIAKGVSGGTIVGFYYDSSREHGFVYNVKDKTWADLDYPGARQTFPCAVDGSNIVGAFNDGRGKSLQGFIYDGSSWASVDVPGWGPESRAYDPDAFLRAISGNVVVGQNGDLYLVNEKRWTDLLVTRSPSMRTK